MFKMCQVFRPAQNVPGLSSGTKPMDNVFKLLTNEKNVTLGPAECTPLEPTFLGLLFVH